MYAAAQVLQSRVALSGAVVKKWMNREMAFSLILKSLEDEKISDLVKKANSMNRDAIEELIQKVHSKIFSNGISIRNVESLELAKDYVYSTYVLGPITPHYFDQDTEEIYVNNKDQVYKIVNNRREFLGVTFDSYKSVQTILERISRGAKEGPAGESNPLNNTKLSDGTRVSWSCSPISLPSFNLRKHAPPAKIEKQYYIENEVASEEVIDVTIAFCLADVSGGIIGEGTVGKSTFLKMLMLEMTKSWRRRILVLERLAELGLLHYFNYHLLYDEFDVVEMETYPGFNIVDLFTNTKQRSAQLLLQAEVLGGEEVENMKMMNRSGHSSGWWTGHFFPHSMIEGLAGLSAEYKKLESTTIEEKDLRKIIDTSVYMESTNEYSRKISQVWEYSPDGQKPIITWEGGNDYKFHKIESQNILRKLQKLKLRFPEYYRRLQEVGLI